MTAPRIPTDIVSAFAAAERIKPSRPLLVAERDSLTYGDLLKRSARLCALFREGGLREGDRVVVATGDDCAAVAMFLALLRCGITAVPVDPAAPPAEADRVVAAARPAGILIDEALRDRWAIRDVPYRLAIRPPGPKMPTLFGKLLGRQAAGDRAEGAYPECLERCAPASLPGTVPGGRDAYILFTSGTTSMPKGVRIGHGALFAHLATLCRQFGYDGGSRLLDVLPLHHADGMIQGPVAAFAAGATVVRPMPFTIPNLVPLLDSIHAHRITHFVAAPTMLSLILSLAESGDDAFRSEDFRFVVSTAAFLGETLWSGFESRFGVRIANVYGLTETVAGSLFSGPGEDDHRIGTVGRPVDCAARVVDESGNDLPDGEKGELLLSGPHLMSGYFDDAAGTQETLADGWLRTGDLAVRDGEGFFRIAGRKKNLVIVGGQNVHPEEVAEALLAHPSVREAAAIGVPDETWGERLVACVVPEGELSEEMLFSHCRGLLSPYKVPSAILRVSGLPRGPSGKVVAARLREQVDGLAAVRPESAGGETAGRIVALAARCFRLPAASLSLDAVPASTPGWDSMAHLGFVLSLEEAFGIRLAPSDILKLTSLREAERIVRALS